MDMSVSRTGAGIAAVALSGLSVLAVQTPASAQTAADCTGVLATASPPLTSTGSLSDTTVVPNQPVSAVSGVGLFAPGSIVEYGVQSPGDVPGNAIGSVLAASDGSASADFTVPSLPDATYEVFFRSAGVSPADNSVCVLPFTSTQPVAVSPVAIVRPVAPPAVQPAQPVAQPAGQPAAQPARPAAQPVAQPARPAAQPARAARPAVLPFTGSDAFIPLTLAGVALLGVGGGLVLLTRRRRREAITPTTLA